MVEEIKKQIALVLTELGVAVDQIELTHPQVATQGEYATNVALIAAKKVGKSPRELAGEIVAKLEGTIEGVERIEVAGPGFINFFLSTGYLLTELQKLLTDHTEMVQSGSLLGKKVMVEFTDPNPFKEFHIGHLYSNTVGESISRLIESQGAEVKRANYQSDVGLHIGKAIYGMQQLLMENSTWRMESLAKMAVGERAKWLGESYALGATAYEENPEAKEKIIEINKTVYGLTSSTVIPAQAGIWRNGSQIGVGDEGSIREHDIKELYSIGRQWSLDYFEAIYQRLGTKFAYYYFESQAGPIGLELVKEYLSKGVFKESQGAVVFEGEQYGLHTRVFINSLGLPTYEAKELGLARTKYADYPFDLSISITGNEINEYFKVLLKVLSLISPEIAEKTRHLSHGMVRLPEGKMSSRTGNVITGEWLLDEAKQRLSQTYPDMTEETVEQVAVGAIKWALLRVGIGKDISFNIDESISFEGDSGPYIQYTYARTQSVLQKAESNSGEVNASRNDITLASEERTRPESLSSEEIALLKLLVRFDEITTEAAEKYSPSMITSSLFDVAQAFNLFYQKHRILEPESVTPPKEGVEYDRSPIRVGDDSVRAFRLALTEATGRILKEGLSLLGIKVPDKM